jgi:phenylacetate-CoA ligase
METNGLGGLVEINFGQAERRALTRAATGQFANVMANPLTHPAQIRNQQADRVAELLDSAYKTVPLYRALFNKAKVNPTHFKQLSDIRRFPIVRRSDIQASKQDQAMSFRFRDKKLFPTQSRGTSGTPVVVRFDLSAVIVDMLQGVRQLILQSSGGVSPCDLTLHYYAHPWWANNIMGKWRSKFVSMDVPASRVADICRRNIFSAITGYPTAIRRIMVATDPGELNLKLIITNSEQSSRAERDQLAAHFNCAVLDEYSTEELTRIAIEMPDGFYYVNEDSVFLEILDPRTGRPVEDGEWGEAVATGLINEAMPLIRYATGDLVKRPERQKLGWNGMGWSRLEAVGGRIQDSFYRQDDSIVPSGVIADLVYRAMVEHNTFFEDYQLKQRAPGEAEISIYCPESRSMTHATDFIIDVRSRLESLLECSFVLVVRYHQSRRPCGSAKRRPVCSEVRSPAISFHNARIS